MAKQSIKTAVKDAVRADAKARKFVQTGSSLSAVTLDSFVNFAHKLGMGADNVLTGSTYGFNPITRNRTLLEWIHRGSWLGGAAVDLMADDMTRAGVEFVSEMEPDDTEKIEQCATRLGTWNSINEVIKWGRLYGGAIGVVLIDGQDLRTPLRKETIGRDQYKGLLVLDRWMVEPTLEDLVTEFGPHLGLPKYYRVQMNAPALRGSAIHYSRIAFRHEGVQLPYQQRLTENLWGLSVLERLYDRMVAFDSTSTGAAQLVHKSHLRTLKIKGLRDIIASGGPALNGLTSYVDIMRRYQGIEGLTMIDGEDDFEVQNSAAHSGMADIILKHAEQLSGALQIPMVRLFGQSPSGFNTGDSEIRQYYDGVMQRQQKDLHPGVHLCYELIGRSCGVNMPTNFELNFRSLWQLTDKDKADINKVNVEAIDTAKSAGLISDQVGMQELRQASRTTGMFTNITEELIKKADSEIEPPVDPMAMQSLIAGDNPDDQNNEVRPQGQAQQVGQSTRRRVGVQQESATSSKAD